MKIENGTRYIDTSRVPHRPSRSRHCRWLMRRPRGLKYTWCSAENNNITWARSRVNIETRRRYHGRRGLQEWRIRARQFKDLARSVTFRGFVCEFYRDGCTHFQRLIPRGPPIIFLPPRLPPLAAFTKLALVQISGRLLESLRQIGGD